MKQVAIVGVGLIGGSFALALRRSGFDGRILGVSSPATIARAIELRVIDAGATLAEACADADLIYLAQPISAILDTIRKLRGIVKPGALITDAGSTKHRIVSAAQEYLAGCDFVGGHPWLAKKCVAWKLPTLSYFEGGLTSCANRMSNWRLCCAALARAWNTWELKSMTGWLLSARISRSFLLLRWQPLLSRVRPSPRV